MSYLFVYGTLRDPEIRFQLTGRIFTSEKTALKGFLLDTIQDENRTYPIIVFSGDNNHIISGEVISISEQELKIFDDYEGPEYRRIMINLDNGRNAWVYCK